jgi:serine/threonine-protein kinase
MDRIPTTIGKYEVIEKIAIGGFGIIYKGWDPFIKRSVAIKMCGTPDEEVRTRFQQEAQFVGNLVHRNITLVFDFGVEDGVPYIVQEFLTGYDLDELLKAGVIGDEKTTVSILLQVCEGLEFAHHRGIVHRDIKPSNIRVIEDGTVKIMDFGIAKSLEAGSKLTQTGIALGTAGYLAPEQIQGKKVDPRTDIFTFGVVAYELVTGKRPFESATLSNVLYRILNEDPEPPKARAPGCSEALDSVIRRCMTKDPEARYQTATELLEDLRRLSAAEKTDAGNAKDQTTGILRDLLSDLDLEQEVGSEDTTRRVSAPKPISTPQSTKLQRTPEVMEVESHHRSPVLLIFLGLVGLLVSAAAVLYFSKGAQDVVFGPDGPPWIPTPTPTATPTATATPTVTPTITPTPEPTATPTPAVVSVRLIVDPPALLTIDGEPRGDQRTSGETTSLLVGTHVFTLSLPDFPLETLTREVTPQTRSISLTLEVGMLTITVDERLAPPGGIAFLDGTALGPVPLIRYKVPAGEHQLVVRWKGVEKPFRKTIDVPQMPAAPLIVSSVAPPQD